MSKNPFAVLADYPKGGPEVPDREKVRREKNKHESGTGRRDKQKREGRGASNWGNALDEQKRPDVTETQEGEVLNGVEGEVVAEPKVEYVPASNFFDSDDEEEIQGVPKREVKRVVKVNERFQSMIVEHRDPEVEVQKYDSDDEEGLETGFLNTQEAIKQRQERHEFRGGRGGFSRGGRGGFRGGRGGRGGHEGGERREGVEGVERRERGERGERREGVEGGERRERGERGERREGGEGRGRGGRGGWRGRGGEDRPPRRPREGEEGSAPGSGVSNEGQGEERKQRFHERGGHSRDQRPSGVQHQRDASRGGRSGPLSMNNNNFPSLH